MSSQLRLWKALSRRDLGEKCKGQGEDIPEESFVFVQYHRKRNHIHEILIDILSPSVPGYVEKHR